MLSKSGRRGEFVAPHGVASQDVAVRRADLGDGQHYGGVFDPGVAAQSAGAGNIAQAAQGAGVVGVQHGGAGEAVVDHRVGQRQGGDLGEIDGERCKLVGIGQRTQRNPARADGAAQ